MRIGIGTDLHHFRSDGTLRLGGATIPDEPALEGHSDGDALLHALCDALLGAAGLEDIGQLFPDTDPDLAGVDSRDLAARVAALVTAGGYTIVNLDAVIEGRRPSIKKWKEQLLAGVAAAFGIPPDRVNVKGKTNEGVGPEGAGTALRVVAVALLEAARPA